MFLSIAQIAVSVALIILILLQERSSGAGGIFGGGEGDFYHTRRGLERSIFIITIFLVIIFTALSIVRLIF